MRDALKVWVETLLSEEARAAVVADGWPRPMVDAGFSRHAKTWDVDAIFAEVERERAEALAKRVAHIWPALPGAGITPVLYATAAGVETQVIKGSSRLQNFTRFACAHAPCCVAQFAANSPENLWKEADILVVSGSDETIEVVKNLVSPGTRVVGYGHRVSVVILEEAAIPDVHETAQKIAQDVVLWRQQGCFSVRALFWVGSVVGAQTLAGVLAEKIAEVEKEFGVDQIDASEAARRAQAKGVAELKGRVWGAGIGWTTIASGSFRGDAPGLQSVGIYVSGGLEDALSKVELAPRNRQGAALLARDEKDWAAQISASGFTRICGLGELQTPPADWPHDGMPNSVVYTL